MRLLMQREKNNRKGPTSGSDQEGPKTPDPKVYYVTTLHFSPPYLSCTVTLFFFVTNNVIIINAQTLRRLAQNREAARKSRLRKKVSDHSPERLFHLNFVFFLHFFSKTCQRVSSL